MSATDDEAMQDEFDVVPGWTADAVEELGADHALPAACRGSGTPAALRWLCVQMGLRAGTTLLDSGAGVGGPAELAAREHDVLPVLVDPMPGACRAAVRLFGWPAVAAGGERLPVRDGAFDAAWSIGVLCTIDDKPPVVHELRRVVRDGSPVGLLVFVRTVETLPDQPSGNSFPSRDEVAALLADARLDLVAEAALADFPEPTADWQRRLERLDEVMERDHGDDERFVTAGRQQQTMGRLFEESLVEGRLFVARAG